MPQDDVNIVDITDNVSVENIDVINDVDVGNVSIVDDANADNFAVPVVEMQSPPSSPTAAGELQSDHVVTPPPDNSGHSRDLNVDSVDPDTVTDQVPGVRRSNRVRRPPVFFSDYVSHAQTVTVLDWQRKVAALLQLMPLFPLQHAEIGNSIMYVITHA